METLPERGDGRCRYARVWDGESRGLGKRGSEVFGAEEAVAEDFCFGGCGAWIKAGGCGDLDVLEE